MKDFNTGAIFSCLLLPALPLLGGATPASASTPTSIGQAVNVTGNILVRNEKTGTGASAVRTLHTGDQIFKDDLINTGSAGSAKVLLTDRSILDLGPTTVFKVDEYSLLNGSDRKVSMSIPYGKVRAAVNTPVTGSGKYMIRTRTAVMGVRGTELVISSSLADADGAKANSTGKSARHEQVRTQVTVIEGKVEVKDSATPQKAPVLITRGEQMTTVAEVAQDKTIVRAASKQDTEVKVVKLNPEQLKSSVQSARIADTTFKDAVVMTAAGNGNSGGSTATLTEIGKSLAAAPPPPPPPPGGAPAGGPPNSFAPPNNYFPPGQPVQLQVVFKK